MTTKKKSVPLPDTGIDWSSPVGEFQPTSPAANDAPPAAEQSSSNLRRAADYLPTLVKSAIAVPEFAVGMADLVTGGRAGKFLENEGGAVGFRPKEARAALDEFYSPEQKAAFQEVQNADGLIGTGMAALRNPSVIGQSVVESLGLMGAGGVVARGLGAVAPGVSATMRGAIGEGVVGAGSAAEQIRQETADGLLTGKQAALGAASGLADTAFGALGGKIAQRLGIADVDTMLAGKGNPATTKGFVRSLLEGAASEGLLEELPQSISEQVLQNVALGKPVSEGVDQAAVLGLLSGGLMGGGANAVNSMFPAAHPADEIRATKMPATGPLTKGLNAAIETHAETVESTVADAVTQTRRQETAPIVEQLRSLPPEQQDEALQMMAIADNMQAPGPVRRRAQNRLDFLFASVAPPVDAAVDPTTGEIAPATGQPPDDMNPPRDNLAAAAGSEQQPVSEADGAASRAAAVAQREADRPESAITPRQDGDILTGSGNPFKNMTAAMRALARAGDGFELARVDGGLVVRKNAEPATDGQSTNEDSSAITPSQIERSGEPDVQLLAGDETTVPGSETGRVRSVRSDGDQGLPAVGRELRNVSEGHGDEAQPTALAGSDQKPSGVRARQRPVGDTRGTDAQPVKQSAADIQRENASGDGLGQGGEPDAGGAVRQAEEGLDGATSIDRSAAPTEPEKVGAAQPTGTLQEQWQDAVKRGDTEAAAKINDQIVAEKKARKAAAPADDTNQTSGTRTEAQAPADQAPAPARSDAAAPASVPAAGSAATAETGGVTLSGEEVAPRDVSGKPLRAKIIAWARTALGGKSFRNQASGSDISVTWQGIKHATSKANDPELRLVAGLPELLQRASYSGSEPDSQKRPDIKAIHRYAAVADLGGERLQVGIVVREMQDGHRFYDHFILPNENPAGIPGAAPRKEVLGVQPAAGNLTVPKTDSGGVPGDRAAPAAKPKPSANTIITDDAAEKARAILRAKLGQVSSGIDPEIMSAGITLALYHVEKGARTFAAYTKAMVGDLGDTVRPYLKSWYAAVLFDPRAGAFTAEMTPLDKLDAAPADEPKAPDSGPDAPVDSQPAAQDTAAKDKTDGSVPTPPRDAARELDQPGQGTLEGAPSTDVRAPGEDRQTRAGADGRSRRDGSGAAGVDRAGDPVAGRLGANPGDVPVPARRTRQRTQDSPQQGLFGASGSDAGTERLRPEQGGLAPEGGVNEAPNGPGIAAPQFKAEDFTIDSDLALGEGGQKTKFKNNVAAIRLVRDLEATGRLATPDEQRTLAQYVGWGGLPQAFDPDNADWAREHKELSELLTPEEFAEARKSTRYAHYTSREIVVDGVYAALRRFGFTGGKTLEAGAGVGNFIGMMPADMRSAGRFTAIEREPFSGAIARQLYPKQNVQQADFTEFKGSDGYYDAAVGNPPFASDPQVDRSGRKHLSGLTLHNYFFAKAIDMLREGGVMGQVITNSFMDAKTDAARKYIGERTRFLGAIRLPNNAFSKNANTEVTTDIVFLQKLPDSEIGSKAARADAKRWLDTVSYTDKNGAQVALNRYFADNPHMMLGDYGAFGTMYGPNQPALVAKPGQDTLAMLKAAVEKLPEGIFKSLADEVAANQVQAAVIALKNPPVREGGYFLEGDKLIQRVTDIAGEARGTEITPDTAWTEKTKLGDAGFARIKALSELRGTVRALIAAEMADDDKSMGQLRARLNEQYDSYRDTHGLLNDPSTLRVFDDDPDYPLLASLETDYKAGIGPAAAKRQGIKVTKSSAKKSAIFTRRVVAARTAVRKVDTAVDALAVSMAERGKLDAARQAHKEVLKRLSTAAPADAASDGDPAALFSRVDPFGFRNSANRVEDIVHLVDQITSRWANAPEVVVAESRDDPLVPPDAFDAGSASKSIGNSEIGSDIGGMYYKKTGVVYLFADKLPGDVQVINVLFHEALGHAGLRGTFGKELGTLLDRLAVLNQGKVRIKARQYDLDYEKPSDRRIAAEELLAEMAQRTPDIGWVKRAIAAIKSWLRDHIPGFSRMKYSDSELIRNFILPSRRFVMQGRPVASVEPTQEGEPPAMFSRSPAEMLRGVNQESIRNAFLDATTSHGSVNLWAKTVGTQYDKAQRNPQTFGRVFNAVQDYIKDISSFANAAADQAPHILPKLDKLSDLKPERLKASGDRNATKADLNAVGAVIFQGTLDKQLLDRPALLAKGLTEKQADLYDEFRAAVNQSLDDVAKTEIVRLAGIAGEPMAGRALAAPTAREAADIMADYLRQQGLPEDADGLYGKVETVEKLQSEGYAPLMRFGKHTVHIQQDGETLFFGMYESRTEANAMARQLRGDPEFSGIPVEQGVMSQESYKLFNGLSIDSLELFANEVGGQDNPVYQDFLKLTKNNRSALKRLIHRNGTAGFSTNTERVLASFVTSNARLASGNLHLGRAKQAANDIPRELGDLKDEAVRLVEYVQNPQEEAQAVRGLLFTTFIGGLVASAVVNMTQPLTMTLPYLSQFGGLTKAGARMMAALKIVAGGKASGEIGQALKRAEADGIVSPQEIHHLQAATTDSLSNNPYLKKAAFIWGSMFSLAEQFNRRLSFVAAYQTALDTGVANPFAFAEKAVIETQGLYNKGNKANWARGAIGSTAMTFKQFSTHYIEWITRMHQSGPEGKRAAITALAILMLAGGAGGLPFADDLDDLIDTLAQALGYDFSAKQAKRKFIAETLGLGDTAAEVATRGVTALPGFPMDLSLRMGMGNLLPATGMFLRSNTDRSRDLLEVAGAAGGLAKMALDGGEKLLGGDPLGAAKAVVPLAIQNVAKSAQMWTTGEYRNQKGAKVTDVDGLDAAMKFIGFQPAEVARESAKVNSIQRTIQLAKNVEADLAGRMAQARVDGDIEAEQEARQELIDWNRKNPQSPIRIRPADIARRAREMRASRVDRLVKSAPKELRPAVQDALN